MMFKRIVAATAASLVMSGAGAAQLTGEVCRTLGGMAQAIMTAYQSGVDIETMFKLNDEHMKGEALNTLGRSIILEAYGSPRYRTPANQQDAIYQFKNKHVVVCEKARQ